MSNINIVSTTLHVPMLIKHAESPVLYFTWDGDGVYPTHNIYFCPDLLKGKAQGLLCCCIVFVSMLKYYLT